MVALIYPEEKSFSFGSLAIAGSQELRNRMGIGAILHDMDVQDQLAVCREHGREFAPCPPNSKLGVAVQTLGQTPIHGLRHPPVGDTNGWYIWAGEYSPDKDFFEPLHASHLTERLPEVARFLGLPPGSSFLLAKDHADVWFDESLLKV